MWTGVAIIVGQLLFVYNILMTAIHRKTMARTSSPPVGDSPDASVATAL